MARLTPARWGYIVSIVVTVVGYAFLFYLLSTTARADWYLDAGIAYHPEQWDCPETCFGSDWLAFGEFGYEFDRLSFGLRHTSAPTVYEDGYGLNEAFVKYRIWGK